ncbi:DUF1707 SHOCT-like domain-containing protein [Amycolatopsis suaedae]|uniref:DUF1707 domain-containing protein n=1 Tax=Amycolatopsis suaedae TaxID=2510978 RepID=A0A4Q7JBY8_9PSEU|nr:DUF1707 domain-containing protein [Amycolatopsis suaedae]RZQ64023.1 DUF1707 domain-containing protein [Amycolatopsis suaedae]
MTTPELPDIPAGRTRASDAEREQVATRIQAAGSEGRLTLAETDERVAAVYAAVYTDELARLTGDLPERGNDARPSRRRAVRWPAHPALRVHAAVAAVIAVLLVVRWVISGVPFFWPAMPMFWLAVSLIVHARVRAARAV